MIPRSGPRPLGWRPPGAPEARAAASSAVRSDAGGVPGLPLNFSTAWQGRARRFDRLERQARARATGSCGRNCRRDARPPMNERSRRRSSAASSAAWIATGWATASRCGRSSPTRTSARCIDPFLLLDYAGPTEFSPTTRAPRRRRASAPRLRDGDHRLRGRGRAPRLLRRRRPDRPRRRAVDDRGLGPRPRGVPRPRLRAARRPLRDGAALGEPARRRTRRRRRATRASLDAPDPDGEPPGRPRHRARDRRRVRGREGARRGPSRRSTSGTCASTGGAADGARAAGRLHDGARRAARRAARERLRADPRRRGGALRPRRASASASTAPKDATALLLSRRADRRADRRPGPLRDEPARGDPPGDRDYQSGRMGHLP